MNLVYKNENTLFVVTLIFSLLFWLLLIVGTLGIALIYLAIGFLVYLFVQSAFISYLRGNGVRVTGEQFPDLHARLEHCCRTLGVSDEPDVYLVNSEGMLNALATKFLGDHFIVLYSEVVEALENRPEALNFYIGHELGHIKRKHLNWGPVLWPGMILPHLGTGYSRAREYTCDLHGLACCAQQEDAERALAVLAAGDSLWRRLDLTTFRQQASLTGGFWMSFHEYTADYPWLVKRMEFLQATRQGRARDVPRRNFMAFLLAFLVPRFGAGVGGGVGIVLMIAILGVLAAVAIPAYQDYIVRASVAQGMNEAAPVLDHLKEYYARTGTWPESLEQAEYSGPVSTDMIAQMYLDQDQDLVIVFSASAGRADGNTMYFSPYLDENQALAFRCAGLEIPGKYLPPRCRQ